MSWIGNLGKKIERGISNLIPHEHSRDKRAQMQATKQQMDMYRDMKDQATKAASELNEQKQVELTKLHQKQIRSLRNNYRRHTGFMNSPDNNNEIKETLG